LIQKNESTRISKFLSLVLRHKLDTIGLNLDNNGWAITEELITQAKKAGVQVTFDILKKIVETNDKKRFVFSNDESKIRVNQGHSVKVDVELKEQTPPSVLFHGTAVQNMASIKKMGLIKGKRLYVHLSTDEETAEKVGMRYGKPVILVVAARLMHDEGYKFYQSENRVWLTDFVLPRYINFPDKVD
jgi:putative RNA 2'-phosphotransferase